MHELLLVLLRACLLVIHEDPCKTHVAELQKNHHGSKSFPRNKQTKKVDNYCFYSVKLRQRVI